MGHRLTVLDNTNADRQTRAVWVSLAHKMDVPIRCVYFTAPSSLCEHNDTVRALAGLGFNPEKRAILPHSAFSSYTSRFQKPKLMEGFHDIVNIDFQVRSCESLLLGRLTNGITPVPWDRRAVSHLEPVLDLERRYSEHSTNVKHELSPRFSIRCLCAIHSILGRDGLPSDQRRQRIWHIQSRMPFPIPGTSSCTPSENRAPHSILDAAPMLALQIRIVEFTVRMSGSILSRMMQSSAGYVEAMCPLPTTSASSSLCYTLTMKLLQGLASELGTVAEEHKPREIVA